MAEPQNYKNHPRIVPLFHFGVFAMLLANFLWAAYRLTYGVTGDTVFGLVVAVALIVMALSLRSQILTVQDRVIRLEMRLRLREILPSDLAANAAQMPVKQLVALRFACDAELPELVREVLDGKVTQPKEIKLRIADWQGDHLRA
jgi:hypothetical protein